MNHVEVSRCGTQTLHLAADLKYLGDIRTAVGIVCRQYANGPAGTTRAVAELELAATELVTNVIQHSYGDRTDGRLPQPESSWLVSRKQVRESRVVRSRIACQHMSWHSELLAAVNIEYFHGNCFRIRQFAAWSVQFHSERSVRSENGTPPDVRVDRNALFGG